MLGILFIALKRSNNQAQRLVVGYIIPNPIDKDNNLIFYTDNREEVHNEPEYPRDAAFEEAFR